MSTLKWRYSCILRQVCWSAPWRGRSQRASSSGNTLHAGHHLFSSRWKGRLHARLSIVHLPILVVVEPTSVATTQLFGSQRQSRRPRCALPTFGSPLSDIWVMESQFGLVSQFDCLSKTTVLDGTSLLRCVEDVAKDSRIMERPLMLTSIFSALSVSVGCQLRV